MERRPGHLEQFTPEITQTEDGVLVRLRRDALWQFSNQEEAKKYFRRKLFQFNSLLWGMRLLVLAGVADVAHSIEETVRTHDPITGGSALAVTGLIMIVQGLNQRSVGERVRLHRSVVRRFTQPNKN